MKLQVSIWWNCSALDGIFSEVVVEFSFGLVWGILILASEGTVFFSPLTFKGDYITTPITIPTPSHRGSHRLSTSTDAVLAGITCGGCEKIRSENINWSPKGKDHKKTQQFPNPFEKYVCQFGSFPQVGDENSKKMKPPTRNSFKELGLISNPEGLGFPAPAESIIWW